MDHNNNGKFRLEKLKKSNVRIGLRVPEDMYEEIAQIAQENMVSMNTLVISCIRYSLKNM